MDDATKINKLLVLVAHLAKDAQMALDDDWDRGDDGFNAQLNLIDQVVVYELGLSLPEVK